MWGTLHALGRMLPTVAEHTDTDTKNMFSALESSDPSEHGAADLSEQEIEDLLEEARAYDWDAALSDRDDLTLKEPAKTRSQTPSSGSACDQGFGGHAIRGVSPSPQNQKHNFNQIKHTDFNNNNDFDKCKNGERLAPNITTITVDSGACTSIAPPREFANTHIRTSKDQGKFG